MKFTLRMLAFMMATWHVMSCATLAFAQEQELALEENTNIVDTAHDSTEEPLPPITNENNSLQDDNILEDKTKEDTPTTEKPLPEKKTTKTEPLEEGDEAPSEQTAEEFPTPPSEEHLPPDDEPSSAPPPTQEEVEQDTTLEPASEAEEAMEEEQVEEVPKNYSVNLSLNIADKMVPQYVVTIPDKISFGTLDDKKESICEYDVAVEVIGNESGDIKILSQEDGELSGEENTSDTIPFTNDLKETSFISSKTITSKLRVKPKDVKKVDAGNYSGTMQFKFCFVPDETFNKDKGEIIKPESVEQISFTNATVSNGLNQLIEKNEDTQKTYFIIDAIEENAPQQNKEYQKYFPDDVWENSETENKNAIDAILDSLPKERISQQFYTLHVVETDGEEKNIQENIDTVLEIRLPVEKQENETISVIRYHEGAVDHLQKLAYRPSKTAYEEGTYFEGADCVYIYSSKFSVYSICKTEVEEEEEPPVTPEPPTPVPPTPVPPVPVPPTTVPPVVEEEDLKKGNYTADISMRKESDFSARSMCDALFASKADLKVDGKETKLTLYIIDPIPNYTEYGTPLTNIRFSFDGETYKAKLDDDDKEKRYFKSASGFIDTAGNYKTSKITVTLPTEAIEKSVNQALTCTAYVNAVMKTTQTFYVVLDDFEEGETKEETDRSLELDDNDYKANVSIRKSTNIDSKSMCDPLFYSQADVRVNGKNTTLTLYVIDPIPSYPAEGTPLSNVRFYYDSDKYNATVASDDALIRYYSSASGFIEQSGDYKSAKITVTVPTKAIETSEDGSLECTAFVNAVMKTEQSFYVVLTDFKIGKTQNSATKAEQPTHTNSQPVAPTQQSPTQQQQLPAMPSQNITPEVAPENHEEVQPVSAQPHQPTSIQGQSTVLKVILGITALGMLALIGYSGYLYLRRKKQNDETNF